MRLLKDLVCDTRPAVPVTAGLLHHVRPKAAKLASNNVQDMDMDISALGIGEVARTDDTGSDA